MKSLGDPPEHSYSSWPAREKALAPVFGAIIILADIVVAFSSAKTAEFSVAGLPAIARAAREIALSAQTEDGRRCVFVVPDWTPSDRCLAELDRLASRLDWEIASTAPALPRARYLRGEAMLGAGGIRAAEEAHARPRDRAEALWLSDLAQAGKDIVAATGKPGDGIVSRYINRPVSQAITRRLLRIPGVTPFHATLGTAALCAAMAAALFLGGEAGMIAGALLFQAASMFDGVDGEIARATFRSSASGAMLDSLIDAVTNLAFIAGLSFNLWQQGYDTAAAAGAAGLAMLAVGLLAIGQRSRAMGGPFTFDVIKDHFRPGRSRLMQWLTWLTMRDFIAAASVVLVLAQLAPLALIAFAVVAAGWLAVTLGVLFMLPAAHRTRAK